MRNYFLIVKTNNSADSAFSVLADYDSICVKDSDLFCGPDIERVYSVMIIDRERMQQPSKSRMLLN